MAGEEFGDVDTNLHEGACSSTTEWDGKYLMDNNYRYSKELLHYCLEREIPFCITPQPPPADAPPTLLNPARVRKTVERLRFSEIPV